MKSGILSAGMRKTLKPADWTELMHKIVGFFLVCTLAAASRGIAKEPGENPALAPLLEILQSEETGRDSFLFADVVFEATGKRMLPGDSPAAMPFIDQLAEVVAGVVREFNEAEENPIKGRRINEGSSYFEDAILEKIRELPCWKADFPKTAQGREQRSGYPDIRAVAPDGSIFYLDPKLHKADSKTSSFRTFYYEPKTTTNKINDDAVHLLAGLGHNGGEGGKFQIVYWNLMDLSKLRVGLKAEFQASNQEMYQEEKLLRSSE